MYYVLRSHTKIPLYTLITFLFYYSIKITVNLPLTSLSSVNHSERDTFNDSQVRSRIMSNFKLYLTISCGFLNGGMFLNCSMYYLYSVLVLVIMIIIDSSAKTHYLHIYLTSFSHMQLMMLLCTYTMCVIYITITVIVIDKAINNYINHYFSFLLMLSLFCNNYIMINYKTLKSYLNTDYYAALMLIFSSICNKSIIVYYENVIKICIAVGFFNK